MTVEIPDEALIIRGGDPHHEAGLDRLRESAQRAHRAGRGYAISVYAGHDPSMSRGELIELVALQGKVPHRQLAVTTAGALRSAGFVLVPDGPMPTHVSVKLGSHLSDSDVEAFRDTFEKAEPNPVHQVFRRGGGS